MNKLILAVLLTFPLMAKSQLVNPEIWNTSNFQDPQVSVSASCLTAHPIKKSSFELNTFALVVHRAEWAEFLIGPSYVSENFLGGMQVGFETVPGAWRVAGWALLQDNSGKGSLLGVYEHGASGYWWRADAMVRTTKANANIKVRAGLMSRRFMGSGPRIDMQIKKFEIWVAPALYDWEADQFQGTIGVGLRL